MYEIQKGRLKEVPKMTEPLFIILNTLRTILNRLSNIITFIFENYFPSATPEEPDNLGFKPLGK